MLPDILTSQETSSRTHGALCPMVMNPSSTVNAANVPHHRIPPPPPPNIGLTRRAFPMAKTRQTLSRSFSNYQRPRLSGLLQGTTPYLKMNGCPFIPYREGPRGIKTGMDATPPLWSRACLPVLTWTSTVTPMWIALHTCTRHPFWAT